MFHHFILNSVLLLYLGCLKQCNKLLFCHYAMMCLKWHCVINPCDMKPQFPTAFIICTATHCYITAMILYDDKSWFSMVPVLRIWRKQSHSMIRKQYGLCNHNVEIQKAIMTTFCEASRPWSQTIQCFLSWFSSTSLSHQLSSLHHNSSFVNYP